MKESSKTSRKKKADPFKSPKGIFCQTSEKNQKQYEEVFFNRPSGADSDNSHDLQADHIGNLAGKWVLITGAAGGIGKAFAKVFYQKNASLILTGRSTRKLLALKKELETSRGKGKEKSGYQRMVSQQTILCIQADLQDPKACKRIYEIISNRKISIDILVNNAGVGDHTPFLESDYPREQAIIDVNISALTNLSWLFGKDMAKRGQGKILNVASVASFGPGPYLAVYYASKAYVLSFSLALHQELQNKDIQVCALCPGRTKSGFDASAHMQRKEGLSIFQPADPDQLAQKAVDALMAGKPVILDGSLTYSMALGARLLSPYQMAWIMKQINQPKNNR